MEITKIKRIGSTNRFHIYVDEKWFGIFLDETLARYGFKTGQMVDAVEFSRIKKENDEKLAFDMAVGYMERYVVSEKGIKDYLKKKAFDWQTIEQTVEKLREYGFVDDERFAKNYFESLTASKGKRAIANKLREKGISNEIVESLLETVDEECEIEKATKLAEKFVKNREKSTKTKQKCVAHLVYKGYDYSVAQKASNNALKNYEGENDDWF